eukprot:1161191-Pelagomonas_calceolata.AAC.13
MGSCYKPLALAVSADHVPDQIAGKEQLGHTLFIRRWNSLRISAHTCPSHTRSCRECQALSLLISCAKKGTKFGAVLYCTHDMPLLTCVQLQHRAAAGRAPGQLSLFLRSTEA